MASIELEKRIKALEDIEEIKNMHREYVYKMIDKKHWLEMPDYWSEEGIVDIRIYGPRIGKKAVDDLFTNTINYARIAPDIPDGGEILTQPVIYVDGDRAVGHWLMDIFFDDCSSPDGPVMKLKKGRYDCEYIRENGKWKFRYLKWTQPWPVEQPPVPDA
ncbi:nuclear transport factor 2 family protein [Chloroflexota bacterium]